jgi:hypothetical protein
MPEEENNITSPAPTGGATPEVGDDPLLKSLTDRVMGQADIVRSGTDRISDAFETAREEIIEGKESTKEATGLQFEALRDTAEDVSRTEQQAFTESRRGFATNTAVLRDLKDSAQKRIDDLTKMEQEAYAKGNAEAAEKLASLRLQEIEYTMDAEQQIYNNMIQEMTLGLQLKEGQRSEQRLQMERQQLLQDEVRIATEKRMFMAQISSQHGVSLEEGDTLESLLTRVSEKDLSPREQAEIDLLYAQIRTQETQNQRYQQEIAIAQRMASEPSVTDYGFENKDRQMMFFARAAAYKQHLNELSREAEADDSAIDLNREYQDLIDTLATEYAGDIAGGYPAAKELAKRMLGMTPAGEESVTFNDNLEDLPGTHYFGMNTYSETLPDIIDPWNVDYTNMPIGSRSIFGGMEGTSISSPKIKIGDTTSGTLKYQSEEDKKEAELDEAARRGGLTR